MGVPLGGVQAEHRLRYDTTDGKGTITLRRARRLHHLNIGAAHARRRVLAIVDEQGTMIEFNQAISDIFGVRREEMLGRPYWDVAMQVLPPEARTLQGRALWGSLDVTIRGPLLDSGAGAGALQPRLRLPGSELLERRREAREAAA